MLKITHGIDRLSEWVGITVRWFFVVAVVISAGNAISRRVFDISSNAFLELQWYLFAAGVLLGAAYVLLKDGHVRVDFVSTKLSARTNATVDAVALSLFAIPFCLMLIWYSWPMFEIAWRTGEMSSNAGADPLACASVLTGRVCIAAAAGVCGNCQKNARGPRQRRGAWWAGSRIYAQQLRIHFPQLVVLSFHHSR